MKISEMVKKLQELQEQCGDVDVCVHDSNDGTDTFGISVYIDKAPTEDDVDYAVIGIASDIEGTSARTVMKVEVPDGYLIVQAKGAIDEYPGVCVFHSADGVVDLDRIVACVEYGTCCKEVLAELYVRDGKDPAAKIYWDSQEVVMW